jgi:hypothetical protein
MLVTRLARLLPIVFIRLAWNRARASIFNRAFRRRGVFRWLGRVRPTVGPNFIPNLRSSPPIFHFLGLTASSHTCNLQSDPASALSLTPSLLTPPLPTFLAFSQCEAEKKKTVSVALSNEQYQAMQQAIATWRQAQMLLKRMEQISRQVIFETRPDTQRRNPLTKRLLGLN